jgi:FKBP-type peptidyl-prolyl cis-trans isomerase
MKFKSLTLSALVLVLVACESKPIETDADAATDAKLETESEKFSYGLGMMIGERVLKQYGEVNYDLVLQGMKAQHNGETTQMTIEEAGNALNAHLEKTFVAETDANKQIGEDFLKENAKKEGITVTESGIQYLVITEGDGAKPTATDQVTVHYRGTLIDGTEFDSSYSRGAPATFGLNQVIPGWTEGVQLMGVGSKYQFFIPYNMAYGERGAGGSIGPFEALIFEIELLEINS